VKLLSITRVCTGSTNHHKHVYRIKLWHKNANLNVQETELINIHKKQCTKHRLLVKDLPNKSVEVWKTVHIIFPVRAESLALSAGKELKYHVFTISGGHAGALAGLLETIASDNLGVSLLRIWKLIVAATFHHSSCWQNMGGRGVAT
jgi:hypothetical protein